MLFWMPCSNREKGDQTSVNSSWLFILPSHLTQLGKMMIARETCCSKLTISRLLHLQGKKTDPLKSAIIKYFPQLSTYQVLLLYILTAALLPAEFFLNLIKPRTLQIKKDKLAYKSRIF